MIRRLVHGHLWIAAALALIVIGAGLIWNTRVAAGADAYGYVSQAADLWLRGDLHIDQRFGAVGAVATGAVDLHAARLPSRTRRLPHRPRSIAGAFGTMRGV